MAIVAVKQFTPVQSKTAGTSTALAVPTGGVAINNLLVVFGSFDPVSSANPVSSVTDTRGNTYNLIAQSPNGSAVVTVIYASEITTALLAADAVTFNHASLTARAVGAVEFNGAGDIRDGTPANTTGSSTTPSGGVTTTKAGTLVLGVVGVEAPSTNTFTQDADTTGGSWVTLTSTGTTGNPTASNQMFGGAYKITTAAGAQTYNPTIATAAWAESFATFDIFITRKSDADTGTGTDTAASPVISGLVSAETATAIENDVEQFAPAAQAEIAVGADASAGIGLPQAETATATDGQTLDTAAPIAVTLVVELWENGAFKSTLSTQTVSYAAGTEFVVAVPWTASALTDLTGTNVEVRVRTTSAVRGLDIGAVSWDVYAGANETASLAEGESVAVVNLTVFKNDDETGVGTDNQTIARTAPTQTESAAAVDAETSARANTQTDTAVAAEAQTSTAAISAPDTGAGTEAVGISGRANSDTAFATDGNTLVVTLLTQADTATAVDAVGTSFRSPTVQETATEVDNSTLAVTAAVQNETATGAESAGALVVAIPTQTESGTATETSLITVPLATQAETGTATDAASVARATSVVETGSGTDANTSVRSSADPDIAVGADTESVLVLLPSQAETATATDAQSSARANIQAETSTMAESQSLVLASTTTESATGTDTYTLLGSANSDNGSGNDSQGISAVYIQTDTATATETQAVTVTITETATATEAHTSVRASSTTETATGADSQALTQSLVDADTGSGADATGISGRANSDTSFGADAESVVRASTQPETAAATETQILSLSGFAETAAAADTQTVARFTTQAEAAAAADAESSARTATQAETGTANDSAPVAIAFTVTETATGTDSDAPARSSTQAESGAAVEAHQSNVSIGNRRALRPTAVLAITGLSPGTLSYVQDNAGAPDANWMNGTAGSGVDLRVAMEDPAEALTTGAVQRARVLVRLRG